MSFQGIPNRVRPGLGAAEQGSGKARVMSGRWWRSEFASPGMAMPAPGRVLRHGDLKCGLWDGWWPAAARERRAVEALCRDLEDVGGCVGPLSYVMVAIGCLVGHGGERCPVPAEGFGEPRND